MSTGHGRRARRTVKAALAPAWTGFADAAQVAQVHRTDTRKGKKTVEVVYLITSDRMADPAVLAPWVKGHRETDNKLHRVRVTRTRSRPSTSRSPSDSSGSGPSRRRAARDSR